MQYQVPQFIEVEDKIFGPLTGKQFIYLAGGIGFAVGMWLILPLWLAIIVGGPVAGLAAALAFLKIHDRPFVAVMQAAFEYMTKTKLYIWKKKEVKVPNIADISVEAGQKGEDITKYVPATTGSKIKELAWSLDIKESMYSDRNQK